MSILIDADTTFIVQGITGREAVNLTRECLDYGEGAKIVGGVTPGRKGRDVHGVPVYDTVAQVVEAHGGPIDGSVVTVPPAFTKDAVFEAIENGIKLVVDRHRAHPAPRRRADGRARDAARRAHHRPQLPRDDRPRRRQDGRHRRPRQQRGAGLHARPDRRHQPLRRHDDRDVEHAERGGPRPVDRGLDRRRRDHRLDVRRAHAALRSRRADRGDRHLHRARRPDGGRAREVGHDNRLHDADRRVHGRAASWTRCRA